MTREEALKIWLPVIEMGVANMRECKEALDIAIKALEQEPSSSEKPNKWIPCSERLPEEDGEYLATIYDMDENYEYIDIAELEDGKWCYKPYILVKAWMPLPDKYKGERKE